MLKIENLSKSFGKLKVLDNLSLTVEDGTIFGLVGVNGAGKSTLLRLISGVYEPDEGVTLLDGRDTCKDSSARADIAFVSDETHFPLAATISSLRDMYETFYVSFDKEAYEEYMKVFELNEKSVINNLSKGIKRRVSLVMALSLKPRLLLLDEAYDGLEPLARYRLKGILADMMEEGTSVIISSHNLKELEDICDSFGILDGGCIKESGDLLAAKSDINNYQVALSEELEREAFEGLGLEIVRFERQGQVIHMVIRGDQDEVKEKLNELHPLLLNVLPVNFEELFIYEVEKK